MTNQLAKPIVRVWSILLSLSIFVAGICLCHACVGIYRTGDHPFSREVVAQAFRSIRLPVYLCLGLTIGAFVLDVFLPGEKPRLAPARQNALILKRLHGKVELSRCEASLQTAVAAEHKRRRLHGYVTALLLAAGSGIFLVYALAEGSFHQSRINESMVRAMGVLVPCMLVPFGYAVFAHFDNAASMIREIGLLKQADGKKDTGTPSPAPKADPAMWVRKAIFVIAIGCLIFGYLTGGTADVLTKAVNICTECVGLG